MPRLQPASRTPDSSEGQLISPPQDFRRHVVEVAGSGGLDMAAIERAERALNTLSVQFPVWMQQEIAALVRARDDIRQNGMSEEARTGLYMASHNLRGQAQMMNFPLVGAVSETLCNLLDRIPGESLPLAIIDLHVEAARAMVSENAAGDSNGTAINIAAQLSLASECLIRKQMSEIAS